MIYRKFLVFDPTHLARNGLFQPVGVEKVAERYRFRATTFHDDGASLRPQLRPHGYRTTWFYFLCLLVLGAASASLYCLRINRTKAREAALVSIVEERTRQLKAAKEAAEKAWKVADAANHAKSEFLASMSHEIRTPMNGILGMTELAMDTDPDPTRREYLRLVKSSAESLLTVINDILDISKIEAGKLEFDQLEFSLRDCLGEALKTLALRAHEKRLELALRVAPEVPDGVVGDPTRLRQIVVNLVGNALKFTEEGEVVVRVRLEASKDDEVALHFSVADTGIGIPPEKRQVIFEAFAQAEADTGRRYGGTGLGLTISSRLVTMMGGRMWVESEVRCGSTFHFTLRFLRGKSPTTIPHIAKLGALRDLRVLVVDDNAANREILEELLIHWGMKPTLAKSGQAGIAALEQGSPAGSAFSLILLDRQMPDMDGFDFAGRAKANTRIQGAMIMMLNTDFSPDDSTRCRELGVAAHLVKPLQEATLLETILTVLGFQEEQPTPERARVKGAPPHEDRLCLRILLAEDNAVNQMVAVRLLEKLGHTVTVVASGRHALNALDERGYDLVLMDVQMPEMDGYEATRKIREKEADSSHHIPIIAMTAHAMKGDRERCLASGMDGYVSKPIRQADLLAAIENALQTPQPTPVPEATVSPDDCVDWSATWVLLEDDRELLRELATLFLQHLPKQMQSIHSAAGSQSGNLECAVRRLRTSLANFGARPAIAAALRVEKVAREGPLADVPDALSALNREIRRLQFTLEEWAIPKEQQSDMAAQLPPPEVLGIPDSGLRSGLG